MVSLLTLEASEMVSIDIQYSRNIAHKLLAGDFVCDQGPRDVFSDSRYSDFAETLVTSARLREYTLAFRYRSMTWSTTGKRAQPLVAFGPAEYRLLVCITSGSRSGASASKLSIVSRKRAPVEVTHQLEVIC